MNQFRVFIEKNTRGVGQITADRFGGILNTDIKANPMDLVTEVDLLVNQVLVDNIKAKYPDHGIISEELGEESTNKQYVWIIDPLDGTLNYTKGIPSYAILVALTKDGETIMGCVYDPLQQALYFAEKNKGAFLNGQRIHHSAQPTLIHSVGLTSDALSDFRMDFLGRLKEHVPSGRIWSSSNGCTGLSCAYVAEGKKDWYVCSGSGKIWDYAATVLLLRESGCLVTDIRGNHWKCGDGAFIAASPTLHAELLNLVNTMTITNSSLY